MSVTVALPAVVAPPPGVAIFDYYLWASRYPELAGSVAQGQAQAYFAEATLYLSNRPDSIVTDLVQRLVLLGMLTAHIAKLNARLNGQAASDLVGRISNASEGSVSVQADYGIPATGSAPWFQQTRYGAAYWTAMAGYRTMNYVAGPAAWPAAYGTGWRR